MDYAKAIAEVKEKIQRNGRELDNRESYLREVRNELLVKRDQVLHLTKELEEANTKNFQLSTELDNNKSLVKEANFNLKLTLQKLEPMEKKLMEVNAAYTNLKLKEEMKLTEIEILKSNTQKIALENHHLSREVDELRQKMKCSQALTSELEDRQTKLTAIIGKTKSNVESLEKEHQRVIQLEEQLQSVNKLTNRTVWLVKENERLVKKNAEMENALIASTAKYDKLCSLVTKHGASILPLDGIKFLQWESQHKTLQKKNINYEEIIRSLTTSLNEEIKTNTQLVEQNEKNEARIHELEGVVPKKIKEEIDIIEME